MQGCQDELVAGAFHHLNSGKYTGYSECTSLNLTSIGKKISPVTFQISPATVNLFDNPVYTVLIDMGN